MKFKKTNVSNVLIDSVLVRIVSFLFLCFISLKGICQTGEETVHALIKIGFENVGWTEDEKERVYVIQNSTYRLEGIGIGKAVDVIQQMGLPTSKPCRLIVLDNNIPQISLCYQPVNLDSVSKLNRSNWNTSYDLGDSWKRIKNDKRKNSSLFKVDVVIYPELMFRNYVISKVYEVVVNVSPAIEISLWRGMIFSGQIIFPIKNDYGERYKQIRPGFLTFSQTIRLPQRVFVTASAGTFNNFRWGVDVRAKHFFKDERFSIETRLGYTGKGYFDRWAYSHGTEWCLTGSVGGGFYWSKYNTQFKIKTERYLQGEYGVRGSMMRNFRYTSIGFYAMKVEHAGNGGINGGFVFQVALPPYKQKRKGYMPRINGGDFALKYNAGNEEIYGQSYRSRANENDMRETNFNPYFIKSELLNN